MATPAEVAQSETVETIRTNSGLLRVIRRSINSEAALLAISGGGLEGLLCARDVQRTTPSEPSSQLMASFIVHGDYQVRQSLRFAPHAHQTFELNLVTAGSWICRVREVACHLGPGDAMLVQPGDIHDDQVSSGTRYRGLRFSLHHGWRGCPLLLRTGLPPQMQLLRGAGGMLLALLDRCQAAHDPASDTSSLVQDTIVLELVWRMAAWFPAGALQPELGAFGSRRRLRRALLDCFERHCSERSSVALMARELGISLRCFQDRVQACFGVPPARAFMRYRLERARLELKRGCRSIRELSQELGFGSPFHFSRSYKAYFGVPPSTDR
jgi:AraC-like DNA-binding protein